MTEAEWLTNNLPENMLAFLGNRSSERKLRYFVNACANRVMPEGADEAMKNALDVADRSADGLVKRAVVLRARKELTSSHSERYARWPVLYTDHIRSVPNWYALGVQNRKNAGVASRTCAYASKRRHWASGGIYIEYPKEELISQCVLLRDIFGNPFRPVSFDPHWLTPTVVALANGIYAGRAFDRMPILADALEEAGCDNADVLLHCRGDGPHVKGCWVVDAVLGKE